MHPPARPFHRVRTAAACLPLLLAGLLLVSQWPHRLHAVQVARADEDDDDAANMVQVPSRVRVHDGRTELLLSPAGRRNAGIVLARPLPAPAAGSVQGYGQVLDAASLTDLASRYRSQVAQLAAARQRAQASQAALRRTRSLYLDRQNMSAAQLQSAQSAAAADQSSLNAAQASLQALSATLAQSWGPRIASAVRQDSPLLQALIQRRQFLVAVTLPPGIVPASPPTSVHAQLPGGKVLELMFLAGGTTANPLVQGLRYYYRVPATAGLLSGLNLPIIFTLPGSSPTGWLIPESAVVWLQGKPWIYRLLGAAAPAAADPAVRAAPARPGPSGAARETFLREPIAPRRQTGNGSYVVDDLPADAQVVVQGAQLLLAEELRAQVQSQDND